MGAARKRLGELLVDAGAMDAAGVQLALSQQRVRNMRFGQTAVDLGLLPEDTMVRTLAAQLGVSAAPLDTMKLPPAVALLIPRDVAQRFHVLPLGVTRDNGVEVLFVATSDPQNVEQLTALQTRLGRRVRPVLAGHQALSRVLDETMGAPVPRSDPSNPAARSSAAPSSPAGGPRASSAGLRAIGSTPPSNPGNPRPGASGTNTRMPPVAGPAPTAGGRGAVLLNAPTDTAPTILDLPVVTMPEMLDVTMDNSMDIVVDHGLDGDPTAVTAMPVPPAPAPAPPPPPPHGMPATFASSPLSAQPTGKKDPKLAAGSVYVPTAPAMTAQVRAMVAQRLVDDELVWVFIDQGILTESDAAALRGIPLPPRKGAPR